MAILPAPLQIDSNAKSWFNKLRSATQANTVAGSGAVTVSKGATETRINLDPYSLTGIKSLAYQTQGQVSDLFGTQKVVAEADYDIYRSQLLNVLNTFPGSTPPDSNTLPATFQEYSQYSDRNIYCWWKGYRRGEVVYVPYRILCGFDGTGYDNPVWALPGVYVCVADVPPVYKAADQTLIQEAWTETAADLRDPAHSVVRDTRSFYTPTHPARKLHPDLLKPFINEGSLTQEVDANVVFPQLRYWDMLSLATTELTACNANGELATYLVAGGRIDKYDTEEYATPANPYVLNWQQTTVTNYINSLEGEVPDIDTHPELI